MVKKSSSKKIIGLTEPSSFTADCISAVEDYLKANPLKLCHQHEDNLEHWLGLCDSVVLAGGSDIHPITYDGQILAGCNFSRFDLNRDIREIRVINYCQKYGIPMLGICRGHQMLGIYYKMKLIADISGSYICHSPSAHQINLEAGTPLHKIELKNGYNPSVEEYEIFEIVNGIKQYWVNSYHHQGLLYRENEDEEIKITATALLTEPDENGESLHVVEMMRGSNWISCQWHPEADWMYNSISKDVFDQFKELMK